MNSLGDHHNPGKDQKTTFRHPGSLTLFPFVVSTLQPVSVFFCLAWLSLPLYFGFFALCGSHSADGKSLCGCFILLRHARITRVLPNSSTGSHNRRASFLLCIKVVVALACIICTRGVVFMCSLPTSQHSRLVPSPLFFFLYVSYHHT